MYSSDILKTKRLRLRYFKEEDIEKFMEYRNDEDWMIHQTFKGKTKEEYRGILLTPFYIEKGAQLAICLKDTDELIGDIYIEKNNQELFMGYTIHPSYARRGYMIEVLKEFIHYLFNMYPDCNIVAETNHDNTASIKLLNKLHFIEVMNNEEGLVFKRYNK